MNQERYEVTPLPWDTDRPDFNLTHTVTARPIPGGKALEIGCGTGSNAVWLAQKNFSVTATDVSGEAINMANQRASMAGVQCRFLTVDFMLNEIPGAPFDFAFDRGCFHCFDNPQTRQLFARNVAKHLIPGGLWLSLIGSADSPQLDTGPPQHTAADIITAVESWFEIISLTTSHFGVDRTDPPCAWVCLMRKRNDLI
ncbi:MAG: class I SAM-dependent methyltransferase [Candidatus Binatia bacterium]